MAKQIKPSSALSVFLILFLTSISLTATMAVAENANLSSWTKDLSETITAEKTGDPDQNAEIAVVGFTVHVIWQTVTKDSTTLRIYYKRSTDGGKTFSIRKCIHQAPYVANSVDNHPDLKRMAVDGTSVHVVTTIGGGTGVKYIRSTDNGATFRARVIFTEIRDYERSEHVMVDATAGRVTVAWKRWRHADLGYDNHSWILVRNSDDNGATFGKAVEVSHTDPVDGGDCLMLSDLKLIDDDAGGKNVYVLYAYKYTSFRPYLAVSTDNGATFPVKNLLCTDNDNAGWDPWDLQDSNYVPKIAAVGNNVYVAWSAHKTGVAKLYFRRLTDSGATMGPLLNLTGGLPEGRFLRPGQETIAAQGNNVYVVYLSCTSAWQNPQVHVRRSANGGASFSGLTTLTAPPEVKYAGSGWWPRVMTQPGDAPGAKVHVLWNDPTYVYSANAGGKFTNPVLLSPEFSWAVTPDGIQCARPRMAVGDDGKVHWVAEGYLCSSGACGDPDVFYRRLDPPATPAGTPMYLSLSTDPTVQRFDNLQIPASKDINFTTAMTVEAWIKPNLAPGTWSYVVYKDDPDGPYQLYQVGDGRPRIWISTTAGNYSLIGPESLPNGVWCRVAMTYDANAAGDNFCGYINGEGGCTRADGSLKTNRGVLFVGIAGKADSYRSLGIRELRLWSTARTQKQINDNMNKSLLGTEPGLRAYYPLNGSTVDETERGNDGVLMYKERFLNR